MLDIENVSFSVENEKGRVQILKDVNLSLKEGSLYVVTGPNGGGKSSLAKIIMGIYRATSGKIWFEGQDITQLDVSQRAQCGIGYAFQQPPRFKGITVRKLLELATLNNNEPVDICELLLDVGLCAKDYMDREVDASLSGGELKRIEIATVLAKNMRMAIFDEPEAGIDLWSFQKLADTFERINAKHKTTILIISHQERIVSLADQVILIANGEVRDITTKERFLSEIKNFDEYRCGLDCGKGVGTVVRCN